MKPLTPVHIGSGNELMPDSYIIKQGSIYFLNQPAFIAYLLEIDRTGLYAVLNTNDLLQINGYFREKFQPVNKQHWISSYEVDPDYEESYLKKLSDPRNQQLVQEYIRNPWQGLPYLPGSSLKGVLRTALLSSLIERQKIGLNYEKNDQNLQARILGYLNQNNRPNIQEDPFKFFRVADASFPVEWLNIVKMERTGSTQLNPYSLDDYRRMKATGNLPGTSSIPQYLEILDPERAGELRIELTISDTFWRQTRLDRSEFINIIRKFFQQAFQGESRFYAQKTLHQTYEILQNHFQQLATNEFLLKLGKGSGKEYVSYSQKSFSPKTKNLISGKPLGWFRVSVL